MNVLSIGILLLAFIIVFAAIFIKSFQALIFSAQGEARLGKTIIKGVTFLVIVLGLVGAAVFLETNATPEFTMNDAIDLLKKDSTDSFTIDFNEESQMLVFLNNQLVATESPEKKIVFKKGVSAKVYDLLIDEAVMGNFRLSIDQELLKKNAPTYYQYKPYRFNDKDFWFRLDSLETKPDETGDDKLAYYTFSFGEGEEEASINWSTKKITIMKSNNGKLSNGIQFISDNNWKRSYVVSLGAGKYGGMKSPIHIDLVQSELAIIDVDD